MKLKHTYLLLLTLIFFTCRDDRPLVSLPQSTLNSIEVDITSVNGAGFEATISNLKGFKIGETGFFISKTNFECPNDIDNTGVGVEVIPNESSSQNVIKANKSNLDLNEQIVVRAYVEVLDTVTNQKKLICSNLSNARTGNLSVTGFSEVIERDGQKVVRLTGRLTGLKVLDEASNHGFVWYSSETPIENEPPSPETLLNANENSISKGIINENKDFESEINNQFLPGIFYYVMPFVELNGQFVFDRNDDGSWKYEEVFIGDFWEEIENGNRNGGAFPQSLAEAVSFEIDGVGYIGTGFKVNGAGQFATATFWAYYPETNEYKRVANFPGIEDGRRRHAVGFAINGKGYVGLGYIGKGANGSNSDEGDIGEMYQDFYEFTPDEDEGTWRQLADAPFPLWGAAQFTLGDKGYVVAGWICINATTCGETNRVFRFDPTKGPKDSLNLPLGEWAELGRVPNNKGLVLPVGFAVNGKGYLATGVASNGSVAEVYEFTPTSGNGIWEKKRNFFGAVRQKAVSFVIGDKAYIATGSNAGFKGELSTFNDLWEYDSENDFWVQKTDIDEFNMDSGTAFTIDGKGYVYGGFIATRFSTISLNMRVYTPEKETFKKAIQNN